MIGVDSRFRGNDGLSRGLRPGFHRPEIASRAWCVIGFEKAGEGARGAAPAEPGRWTPAEDALVRLAGGRLRARFA